MSDQGWFKLPGSRKRSHADDEETEDPNDKLVKALSEQTKALKTQNELIQRQTNLLEGIVNRDKGFQQNQTILLGSMDARLGRLESSLVAGLVRRDTELQQTLAGVLTSVEATRDGFKQQVKGWTQPEFVVAGSWKFKESKGAEKERVTAESEQRAFSEAVLTGRQNNMFYQHPSQPKPHYSFGLVTKENNVLDGDAYPANHNLLINRWPSPCYNSTTPRWVDKKSLLPELVFNDNQKLPRASGMYCLALRYDSGTKDDVPQNEFVKKEAGIIIGDINFNSNGYVCGKGADWDRMLNGLRQTQLPHSSWQEECPWMHRKISEPWNNGDILRFKIDTNDNTVVFQKEGSPQHVFWNVLAYTNNPQFPEYVRAYAYCGGCTAKDYWPPKLTIVPHEEG